MHDYYLVKKKQKKKTYPSMKEQALLSPEVKGKAEMGSALMLQTM